MHGRHPVSHISSLIHLTPLAALLSKVLIADATKRATLKDIKNDPWFVHDDGYTGDDDDEGVLTAADDFEGTLVVHAVPALSAHAGIELAHQGEGLPSLTKKAMSLLTRKKVARRGPTSEERATLWRRQSGKCELCDPLGPARAVRS